MTPVAECRRPGKTGPGARLSLVARGFGIETPSRRRILAPGPGCLTGRFPATAALTRMHSAAADSESNKLLVGPAQQPFNLN